MESMRGIRISLPIFPIIISALINFIQLCVAIFFLSIWVVGLLFVLGIIRLICVIMTFGSAKISRRSNGNKEDLPKVQDER